MARVAKSSSPLHAWIQTRNAERAISVIAAYLHLPDGLRRGGFHHLKDCGLVGERIRACQSKPALGEACVLISWRDNVATIMPSKIGFAIREATHGTHPARLVQSSNV